MRAVIPGLIEIAARNRLLGLRPCPLEPSLAALAPYPALLTLPAAPLHLPLFNGGARFSGMSRTIGLADRFACHVATPTRPGTSRSGLNGVRWLVAFGKHAISSMK